MKKILLSKKMGFALLILAVLTFIILSIFIHYHDILRLDVFLSRDLQSEGNSPERQTEIYHFLYAISLFGKPVISAVMVFVTAVLFWLFKYYRETIFCLLTSFSALINWMIKIIVNRPRPTDSLVRVLDRELDQSFPSGHVVFYTVFFGFILAVMISSKTISAWIRVTVGTVCFFMILLVSFSRVYLGAHWVSDTIGGYLVGGILLSILLIFYFHKNTS